MKELTILIPTTLSDVEAMAVKLALQKIAQNFNTGNIKYIAELSEKSNVNKKFDDLKNNMFVKSLLK